MTKETFKEAKRLYEKIAIYNNKLKDINDMIRDCEKTAYSEEELNVSVYNGGGKSHSAYINMTLVKNMLIGAKEYYEALIDKCESDIRAL